MFAPLPKEIASAENKWILRSAKKKQGGREVKLYKKQRAYFVKTSVWIRAEEETLCLKVKVNADLFRMLRRADVNQLWVDIGVGLTGGRPQSCHNKRRFLQI